MIEHFENEWGAPGSYSSSVRHNGLIYTAGQLGLHFLEGGKPYELAPGTPMDFESQVELALKRLIGAVEVAGGGLDTILRITGYVDPRYSLYDYDAVYRRVISVKPKPVRTTFYVGKFPGP